MKSCLIFINRFENFINYLININEICILKYLQLNEMKFIANLKIYIMYFDYY
jgi:hypothetical protein